MPENDWLEAVALLGEAQQYDFLADHAKEGDPGYEDFRKRLDAFLQAYDPHRKEEET